MKGEKGKMKNGSKITIKLENSNVKSREVTLWDWTDECSLESLLNRDDIWSASLYNGRYMFDFKGDEMVYLIDPTTKRVECIPKTEGGLDIYDDPDRRKISLEELRRALS